MEPFLTGIVAGYGIAIPVGAIAVLIVDTGLRRGLAPAFFAGAGAATADLLYASLAVLGGVALSDAVGSVGPSFRIASALVLIVIALQGLRRIRSPGDQEAECGITESRDLGKIYFRFVALTVINPTTIVYFAAVIIGLGVADGFTPWQGALFVSGAFLASLSWQTVLAVVGSVAGQRLGARTRTVAAVLGNLVVLTLAVVILVQS